MKVILISLLMVLGPSLAWSEGGSGLTGPDQYYNPDVKCSVRSGLVIFVNLKPEVRVSAQVYDSRANRVSHVFLNVGRSFTQGEAELYPLAQTLKEKSVGFIAIRGTQVSLLNVDGEFSVGCR